MNDNMTAVFGDLATIDLAREATYRFLSVVLENPDYGRMKELWDSANRTCLIDAAELLREEYSGAGPLAPNELPSEELRPELVLERLDEARDQIGDEHARVFGFIACRDCPPCETEYYEQGDAFFRAQQMADVSGFYRAFGLLPSRRSPERPDHVAMEMGFMAFLLMKKRLAAAGDSESAEERRDRCESAERTFLDEHLAWWIPSFARLMRAKDEDGLYGTIGMFLSSFMAIERARHGLAVPRRRAAPSETVDPEQDDRCLVQITP